MDTQFQHSILHATTLGYSISSIDAVMLDRHTTALVPAISASMAVQYSTHSQVLHTAGAHLQKAVALAPESESGHHRAATPVPTAVRGRSGASAGSHSKTDCLLPAAPTTLTMLHSCIKALEASKFHDGVWSTCNDMTAWRSGASR